MADIFISYKSDRRAAAAYLADVFARLGYSVWWDYGLAVGRDFGDEIERQLIAARAVVVMWCPLSVKSEWVREEAHFAKSLGKLFPILIDAVQPPLGFTFTQSLNLSHSEGLLTREMLARLAHDLAPAVGKEPSVPADFALDETPLSKFSLSRAVEDIAPLRHLAIEPGVDPRSPSAQTWAGVRDSLDPLDYEDFIATFPQTAESFHARRQLRQTREWLTLSRDDLLAHRKLAAQTLFEALGKTIEQRCVTLSAPRRRALIDQITKAGENDVSDLVAIDEDPEIIANHNRWRLRYLEARFNYLCGTLPAPDQRQLVADMRDALNRMPSKMAGYAAAVRILETEEA